MPFVQLKPANQGGGRTSTHPIARIDSGGQFTLNHAAVALLGDPARVLLYLDVAARAWRILPTTPSNAGGWALSGGGNSQHRISVRSVLRQHPNLAGEYSVRKLADGGIELRKQES